MARSPEAAPAPEAVAPAPVEAAAPAVVDRPNPGFELPVNEQRVQPTETITDGLKRQEADTLKTERAQKNKERADDQKLDRLRNLEKVLESGVRNPEELIEVLNNYSHEELRKVQQERKNGQGFTGEVRAWLRGDKDYYFDQDGKVQHNWKADLSRRAVTSVFNRKNIAAAATFGAMSVITGGVALVSGLTLLGGAAGQFTAEMKDFLRGEDTVRGGTRGARKEIMLAEKERYYELQQLSADYDRSRESDPLQAMKILQQITDIYHGQGEAAVVSKLAGAKENLSSKQDKLTALRDKLHGVGQLVGLGAGLGANYLTGSFGKLDLDLWAHIGGQSIFHHVVTQHGVLHFLWTNADKLAHVAHGPAAHILNAGAPEAASNMFKVLAASIVEQGAPVMLASLLAGLTYKGSAKAEQAYQAEEKNRQKEQHGRVGEHIPSNRAYLEGVARENHNFIPEDPKNFQYDWATQPQTLEKTFDLTQLPQWRLLDSEPNPDGSRPGVLDSQMRYIKVGIAAVSLERNLIAIVESIDNYVRPGNTVFPVRTMRLDDFLRGYQPIIREIEGNPLPTSTTSRPPAVETTSPNEESESSTSSGPASPELSPGSPPTARAAEAQVLAEERNQAADSKKQANPDDIEATLKRGLEGGKPTTIPEKDLRRAEDKISLPEGYKSLTKLEVFDWLQDLAHEVDTRILAAAGIEIGGDDDTAGDVDFIRFVDSQNTQHILGLSIPNNREASGNDLVIKTIKSDGYERSFTATLQAIDHFARRLVRNVNEAIRNAGGDSLDSMPTSSERPEVGLLTPKQIEDLFDKRDVASRRGRPDSILNRERESEETPKKLVDKRNKVKMDEPGADLINEPTVPAYDQVVPVPIKNAAEKGVDSSLTQSLGSAKGGNILAGLKGQLSETNPSPPPVEAVKEPEDTVPPGEIRPSMIGSRIKLDDAAAYLSSSEGVIDGEFHPEDFNKDTELTVTNVVGDLVELSLNGGKLTVEAAELLPHIAEVFNKE